MKHLLCFIAVSVLLFSGGIVLAQQPEPMGTPDTSLGFEIDVEDAASDVVGLSEEIARSTAGSISNILEQILVSPRSQAARVMLMIGGILLLVAGWRIYEFIIILAGILMGASIGSVLFDASDPLLQAVGFVIGGLLGAIMAALMYYVAVFFIGAYVGALVAVAVAGAIGYDHIHPLLLLMAAILGGVVMLGLSFQLLIFLAALVGAQMISLALGLGLFWTLLFTVVGVAIQIMMARQAGIDIRRPPRRRSWLLRRA